MNFKSLRQKAKWWNLAIGLVFMVSSVYLNNVGMANANPLWLWVALISPLLLVLLAALTVPRWQSFVGLAVVAYSAFWFYSHWVGKPEPPDVDVLIMPKVILIPLLAPIGITPRLFNIRLIKSAKLRAIIRHIAIRAARKNSGKCSLYKPLVAYASRHIQPPDCV
jgi:hypothetical protein